LRCSELREPAPRPECTTDDECSPQRACSNNRCIDPCSLNNCGRGAKCLVQSKIKCFESFPCDFTNRAAIFLDHRSICTCNEGLTGNAFIACHEIGCRSDNDCPLSEACINKDCVNQCSHITCGQNAFCETEYHRAGCHCIRGYHGNPLVRCEYKECTKNDDCRSDLTCVNSRCISPCASNPCPSHSECTLTYNHNYLCVCQPGYTGSECFLNDFEIFY
jgi:hypothetical protein